MLVVAVEEARGDGCGSEKWEVGSGRREERRVGGGVRSGKGGRKRGRVDGGLVYVMGFGGLGLCDGARLLV